MDNFRIDVTAEGSEQLALALKVAYAGSRTAAATFWAQEPSPERDVQRLVLSANTDGRPRERKDGEWHRLPAPSPADLMAPWVVLWLDTVDYGPEPDHDGSNSRGFRVYNETWGRIGDDWEAFVAIEPCWAWYGK